MLLPVLNRARRSAWTTRCLANFRQQGLALALYEDDTGRWPDGHLGLWCGLLGAYMDTGGADSGAAVFLCPANRTHFSATWAAGTPYGMSQKTFACDYVINNYVSGGAWDYTGCVSQELKHPDTAMLLLDGAVGQTMYPVVFEMYCPMATIIGWIRRPPAG
jgi:hypothetical protein